ncbi:MAG: hypothetical protein HKN12_03520 [Gemmatimonadetes bacterium]|nr:hypothetical protein [Gemmatimonadota bacterium]
MKMRNHLQFGMGFVALLAVAIGSGCGDSNDGGTGPGDGGGDPAQVAQEWAGVWNLEFQERDCDTNAIISTTTETDTLCASEAFTYGDDGIEDIACTGTWTATSVNLRCQDSITFDGITCAFDAQINGTMASDGSSYNVTVRVDITYTGEGAPPNDCFLETIVGTRVSDSQAGCPGGAPAWFNTIESLTDPSNL